MAGTAICTAILETETRSPAFVSIRQLTSTRQGKLTVTRIPLSFHPGIETQIADAKDDPAYEPRHRGEVDEPKKNLHRVLGDA